MGFAISPAGFRRAADMRRGARLIKPAHVSPAVGRLERTRDQREWSHHRRLFEGAIAQVTHGSLVVAEAINTRTGEKTLLSRQCIAPNLLITNRECQNSISINMLKAKVTILGILIITRELFYLDLFNCCKTGNLDLMLDGERACHRSSKLNVHVIQFRDYATLSDPPSLHFRSSGNLSCGEKAYLPKSKDVSGSLERPLRSQDQLRGPDRDEVSRSRPNSRTPRDCGRVLHLERGASPAAVRAAENAHHKQRQKKPSKFVSRSVLEGSGLLALGFR